MNIEWGMKLDLIKDSSLAMCKKNSIDKIQNTVLEPEFLPYKYRDPDWIRIQEGKNEPQNYKKV